MAAVNQSNFVILVISLDFHLVINSVNPYELIFAKIGS